MTKATIAGLLGGLLATLAVSWAAHAAEATPAPRTYVVLVGISHYADPNIKPRPHAEDDVKAFYDLFTDRQYLGVPQDHVRLLLGGSADSKRNSQPATRENILKSVQWLAAESRRDDLVIFLFIGQGAALGERGDRICYLASNSTVASMAKTGIIASALGEEMDKVKAQHSCAFVDVHFRGYTLAGGTTPPEPNMGPSFFKEFLGHDNMSEETTTAAGHVLFLATLGRHASLDGDKHGTFAQVLLDGLRGKADSYGYEADGVVTVDELSTYLNKELPALVRKSSSPDKDKIHHLVIAGEDSHYVLTHNPTVTAEVKSRLGKFAELVKANKNITPEIAQEGKKFLQRMPKLEAQRTLRKNYQALADRKMDVAKFLEERETILDGTKLRRALAINFSETVIDATRVILKDYVKDVKQGDMVAWAIRGLYRKIDERMPEDIAKKLASAKEMKEKELLALLTDVRMRLGKREDLDRHKDIDYALVRMLGHLDPYTTFYDPESLEREKSTIQGRFIGVGIQIRKDSNTDQLLVITPIMGSPAYKAGIQAGDIITTITLEMDKFGKPLDPPEVIPTKGLDLAEAVKKILGQPNTRVKLTIQRPGVEKPLEFDMVRQLIQVETVLGFKRRPDTSWEYLADPENKIGYIRLTQFTRPSFPDMVKVVADLKKRGLKGLVLDLRFNPGGLLDSARDISDLFIDDGMIVSIRPRSGEEYVMSGRKEGSQVNFPMVCLVNGGSASGSEIVSACLQDHHRAFILGERSYGKGSVQNVVDFEKDGKEVKSQIKLTTASFWRPSGKNLNKSSTAGKDGEAWGVVPDRVLPLTRTEREDLYEHQRNQEIIHPSGKPSIRPAKTEFKDKQLEAALEYLRGQIKLAQRGASAKKAS
jgi:C-terminal peptidase prc